MLGDEMIDEASRKLALVTAAKGRAAGLARTGHPALAPPEPQPSTPQAVSVSARPLVRVRLRQVRRADPARVGGVVARGQRRPR